MCGVFAASISNAMSPWLVLSDIVYFDFLSIFIAGSGAASSVAEGEGEADGLWLAAASALLSLSSLPLAAKYVAPPMTATTATAEAMTTVSRLVLRRVSSRRCCCRSNFSLASCRRR